MCAIAVLFALGCSCGDKSARIKRITTGPADESEEWRPSSQAPFGMSGDVMDAAVRMTWR